MIASTTAQFDEAYELAVVGAGPAGAMAALVAARAGRRVVLVEKATFPRAKVCGCCISGAAVAAIEAAGLDDVLRDAVKLHRFELSAGGRTAALGLHGSVALSRAALDAALVAKACEAGAVFCDATTAELGAITACGRQLHLRTGARGEGESRTLSVKGVIVADGLAGRMVEAEPGFAACVTEGSRLGVSAMLDGAAASCEPGVIRMAVARSGYAGMVVLEDGSINVAAAVDRAALQQANGPGDAVRRIMKDAGIGLDDAALLNVRWRGTPALTRRRERLLGGRLLLAGDAAGYVEPFTGEGIGWALSAGSAAGRFASQLLEAGGCWTTGEDESAWDAAWQRMMWQTVGRPQRRCRALAKVLRWPGVTAAGVGVLRRAPWLGGVVTRPIASPLKGEMA